jgi:competence protein ComFC
MLFSQELIGGILELVYPPSCFVCHTMGTEVICDACLSTLIVPIPAPFCLRCGQLQLTTDCSKCKDYPDELIRCRAVGIHQGILSDLIHQLKYRDKPMLARPLSKLIVSFLQVRAEMMNNLSFDAIVPIPLHSVRERKRGYNQSVRLAIGVGEALSIPIANKAIARVRDTRQQVGMARSGRVKNLEGAFRSDPAVCRGKSFLLLDDVSTTGSTIREAAKELLASGAVKVYAITLAAG